jgi:alpha-ketoglutarate-dependent taurine dioxygenase
MTTAVANYEIRRAGPRFGAEVTGIDLTSGVDEHTAEDLRQAFRDQWVNAAKAVSDFPDVSVTGRSGLECVPGSDVGAP